MENYINERWSQINEWMEEWRGGNYYSLHDAIYTYNADASIIADDEVAGYVAVDLLTCQGFRIYEQYDSEEYECACEKLDVKPSEIDYVVEFYGIGPGGHCSVLIAFSDAQHLS